MITEHIETTALSKHECPFCHYERYEITDADEFPNFCPHCGKKYDVHQGPQECETVQETSKTYIVCFKATGGLEIVAESEDEARAKFDGRLQDALEELWHNDIEVTEIFENSDGDSKAEERLHDALNDAVGFEKRLQESANYAAAIFRDNVRKAADDARAAFENHWQEVIDECRESQDDGDEDE